MSHEGATPCRLQHNAECLVKEACPTHHLIEGMSNLAVRSIFFGWWLETLDPFVSLFQLL